MAIFYHVSTSLLNQGEFVPRIPENRITENENDSMERVCVSTTISNCLSALPGSGNLYDTHFKGRGYYKLFRIDTEKLGIGDEHIVFSQTIYENGWVPDAFVTQEYWITVPFTVPEEDSTIIKLDDWCQERAYVVPSDALVLAHEMYQGDLYKAYRAIYEGSVPTVYFLSGIQFQYEDVRKDEIVTLHVYSEEEETKFTKFISKHFQVEIMEPDKGLLRFRVIEDTNLKMLYLAHLLYAYKRDMTNHWDEEDDEAYENFMEGEDAA